MLLIRRMLERVERDRLDSDASHYTALLLLGEALTKFLVLALAASIDPDQDENDVRYALEHGLARANGLGDWSQSLQTLLTAPVRGGMFDQAKPLHVALTQRFGPDRDEWQRQVVDGIRRTSEALAPPTHNEPRDGKTAVALFFDRFTALRNKSRGHGADGLTSIRAAVPFLASTMNLLVEHLPPLYWHWALASRSNSGRINWIPLSGHSVLELPVENIQPGVHLVLHGKPISVPLMITDADVSDFFLPNGDAKEDKRQFEAISYVTGMRRWASLERYQRPPIRLPASETEGRPSLAAIGNMLSNVPQPIEDYVRRSDLEDELRDVLADERNPVIAIGGPGGIGKTSLALRVLNDVADTEDFEAVLWFSARDVDLKISGPAAVSPNVQTLGQIAREFCRLMAPHRVKDSADNQIQFFCDSIKSSDLGRLLLVFDNFETVYQPTELYKQLNNFIRLPNKILITTRFKDFKGEYAVDVGGMSRPEFQRLVETTGSRLGITGLLANASAWIASLYSESGGHPYVVKVALGEVARTRTIGAKFERIMASREEILDALFDRSYARLSPTAQRTFLMLCQWRAVVPIVALEAVALRPGNERYDVEAAIEELADTSMVQVRYGAADAEGFVSVPVAAQRFGLRRLKLSADDDDGKLAADAHYLHMFGAASDTVLRTGFMPHVRRYFASCQDQAKVKDEELTDAFAIGEFLARKYPEAWSLLAEVQRSRLARTKSLAVNSYEAYLSRCGDDGDVWLKFASLAREMNDSKTEFAALAGAAEAEDVQYSSLAQALLDLVQRLDGGEAHLDTKTKRASASRIVVAWTTRIEQATPSDMYNLARLAERAGSLGEADKWARRGLRRQPNDQRLRALADRVR